MWNGQRKAADRDRQQHSANFATFVRKATEEVFTIHDGNQLVYQGTVRLAPKPLHTYADDVDLLMGTGNSRWMYKPSISLPLGMVQIAPDNEDETWKAGYEYTIENISGFNHFCDWTIDGFLMQPPAVSCKSTRDQQTIRTQAIVPESTNQRKKQK